MNTWRIVKSGKHPKSANDVAELEEYMCLVKSLQQTKRKISSIEYALEATPLTKHNAIPARMKLENQRKDELEVIQYIINELKNYDF